MSPRKDIPVPFVPGVVGKNINSKRFFPATGEVCMKPIPSKGTEFNPFGTHAQTPPNSDRNVIAASYRFPDLNVS